MNSVVVHYQEIALKGKNRPWFVARLAQNLRAATSDLDVAKVRVLMGRFELFLGPAVGPRRAERLQRLGRHDPRRNGRHEALAEERPERLVFPPLNVARRPVVEKTEARDVTRRVRRSRWAAEFIAWPDPDAKLQFVVEVAGGSEGRRPGLVVGFASAHGRRTFAPEATMEEARPW